MLKKIFCSCHRCIKYYLLHDKEPIKFENSITQTFDHVIFEKNRKKDEEDYDIDEVKETIVTRKNIVYGQFMNFVNYFSQIGGFEAIIDYLKCSND